MATGIKEEFVDEDGFRMATVERPYLPDVYKNPCWLCGRELKGKETFFCHVVAGGGTVLLPEDEDKYQKQGDAGDCGFWPVGPECRKRLGKYVYITGKTF